MKKSKAFTMAEAVLVMTILGIIATIMITTMKPAQFKEKGYQVLAKTIYGDIDTAITQILLDKTPYNTLTSIYKQGSTSDSFDMSTGSSANSGEFLKLLKNYLATARGTVPSACSGTTGASPISGPGYDASMLLKNGACIAVKSGSVSATTRIPGEASDTASAAYSYGMIYLDINGDDEPNTIGKDRYWIPLNEQGIVGGS